MDENKLICDAMMNLIGKKLITDKINAIDEGIGNMIDRIIAENETDIFEEIKI